MLEAFCPSLWVSTIVFLQMEKKTHFLKIETQINFVSCYLIRG